MKITRAAADDLAGDFRNVADLLNEMAGLLDGLADGEIEGGEREELLDELQSLTSDGRGELDDLVKVIGRWTAE